MFTEMRNRLDAAMEIMQALRYMRDDVDSSIELYSGSDDEWSRENLARYKTSKQALETVEKALEKFVKQ